jgi:hypothetical protein
MPTKVPVRIAFGGIRPYSSCLEQRRAQRYKLQLPLQILQLNEERVNRTEKTRDISSGGVCFTSHDQVDVGGRIEYIITLSGSTPPVRIRCLGKVLRSLNSPGEGQFEVAVTMERYSFVRPDEISGIALSA